MGLMPMTPALVPARFRRVFVAGVVSALALTACSGGGDDPVAAEKSVEATSTTDAPQPGAVEGSPEVVPFDEFDPADYEVGDVVPEVEIREPVEYPEMANNDEAGAEAAAQYMIDVLNYTYNTGDSTYLNAVADEDCLMCVENSQWSQELHSKKNTPVGPVYRQDSVSVYKRGRRGWLMDLTVTFFETPIVDKNRQVFAYFDNSRVEDQQMVIYFDGEQWKLRAFGEVAFD